MRPIHVPHHANEVQLSAITLRASEASGDRARDLGLVPSRHHQLPRDRTVPASHVCFVHPPIPHPYPRPSVGR